MDHIISGNNDGPIDGERPHDDSVQEQQPKRKSSSSRRISFHDNLTTSMKEIPSVDPETRDSLFYNKQDYQKFQAAEQRRYDKMMMKKIQGMVQEAMADQIEEALKNGATPADIEAMMPQTPDEIFTLLGTQPGVMEAFTKPMKVPKDEIAIHSAEPTSPLQEQEPAKDFTKQEGEAVNQLETTETPTGGVNKVSMEKEWAEKEVDDMANEKETSTQHKEHRPEHNIDYSDDDVYGMLGIEAPKQAPVAKIESTTNYTKDIPVRTSSRSNEIGAEQQNPLNAVEEPEKEPPAREETRPTKGRPSADGDIYSMLGINCDVSNLDGEKNDDPLSSGSDHSKNDAINDVLGTSFSSEVYMEDLVPKSPATSPIPARSTNQLDQDKLKDLAGMTALVGAMNVSEK